MKLMFLEGDTIGTILLNKTDAVKVCNVWLIGVIINAIGIMGMVIIILLSLIKC